MSADDSIADVDAALRRHLDGLLPGWLRPKARKICFEKTINEQAEGVDEVQLWGQRGFLGFLMGQGLPADGVRLIREPRVRRILASEWLVDPDKGVLRLNGLKSRLPTPLIRMAGQNLGRHPHAVRTLEEAIREDTTLQAMGASLLHASATGWRPPDEGKIHFFLGAHLPGAQWRYVPTRYTPGLGIGGVRAFVGFVFSARRIAAGYLSRRGLARPRVPWRQINAIKAQALRN